jgi:hypothetical protein
LPSTQQAAVNRWLCLELHLELRIEPIEHVEELALFLVDEVCVRQMTANHWQVGSSDLVRLEQVLECPNPIAITLRQARLDTVDEKAVHLQARRQPCQMLFVFGEEPTRTGDDSASAILEIWRRLVATREHQIVCIARVPNVKFNRKTK